MISTEKIDFIKKLSWVKNLEMLNKNDYILTHVNGSQEKITARKVNKLFKDYHKPNQSKKFTKWEDRKKNRPATRDALKTEDFDRIPQEGNVKRADIYNWD